MDEGSLNKEARKKVDTCEKIWGHAVGEGKSANRGQEHLRPQKRAQKILKKFCLDKYWKVCVEKLT